MSDLKFYCRAEDLAIGYGKTPLMEHIGLGVGKGTILTLIGPNGAGKSTFLRLLSGKEEPDHGEISVKRGMSVAYLPQTPVLREDDTITQAALDYLPARQGEDPSSAAYEAQTILTQLGFADLNQPVRELSGGQKRRVAIAGVMAMEPKVLILDEPTAGLDPRGRDEILAQIRAYHETKQATVILVSHSMEEIARNVERIVVMRDAHVYMDGTPRQVFARAEELEQAGLDVPQVTKIAMALRKRGMDIDPAVYTIEELEQALLARRGGGEGC